MKIFYNLKEEKENWRQTSRGEVFADLMIAESFHSGLAKRQKVYLCAFETFEVRKGISHTS